MLDGCQIYLLLDIPTHTGEKPYKVSITKNIIDPPTDIGLFQCNICSKDFRQPCPYKKHMQAHAEASEADANKVQTCLDVGSNILTLMS